MRFKQILIIFSVLLSTIGVGQKTVRYADCIQRSFPIPELSYAVIDSKKILEMAALGKHSIELLDTATIKNQYKIFFRLQSLNTDKSVL